VKDSYTNEEVDRFCQSAEDNGKLWGAMEERERIIKLLESTLGIGLDLETTEFRDTVIKNAVKLIKGEQK